MFDPEKPLVWTVYGRLRSGVNAKGEVTTQGYHADRMASRDAALLFLNKGYMKYGDALDAVVVEMTEDKHGCRHVIQRVGQGKAWWE